MSVKVKIALIGDTSVGKTAFIQRFRKGKFLLERGRKAVSPNELLTEEEESEPSENDSVSDLNETGVTNFCNKFLKINKESEFETSMKKKERCPTYTCSVIYSFTADNSKTKEKMIDITFFDVPRLKKFPANSLQEWELDGAIGVRSADAFILLYDVTNEASFDYVKQMRSEILESFHPLNDTLGINQCLMTARRARNKLLQTSQKSESRKSVFLGSRKSIAPPSGRLKKEVTTGSNLTQQIGLLSLYSASFAHPQAMHQNEVAPGKGKLFSPPKTPLIVVVGNKKDLCRYHDTHFYGSLSSSADSNSVIEIQKPLHLQRQVHSISANHLVKKCWKCQHHSCSVKLDWNVTAVVTDILRSFFSAETQKNGRFKKPTLNLKTFSFRK